MLAPLGFALQGLLGDARAMALQGALLAAAPMLEEPRLGGGRGGPRRPKPIDPRLLADARDLEALLLSGAL